MKNRRYQRFDMESKKYMNAACLTAKNKTQTSFDNGFHLFSQASKIQNSFSKKYVPLRRPDGVEWLYLCSCNL